MRLKNITATPHLYGNRIDLKWENPDPEQYPGVRVLRRESTHPTSPENGVLVVEGEGLNSALDEKNLKGETVYYYALFPYKGDPPEYQYDRYNRVSAMATSPFNTAGQMYDLLPVIYHRYDTVLPKPDKVSEKDQQRGQLRRFLDLPGSQLDQLYSFAKAMLDGYNPDKVDGRMLPLLAQWIGWKTDYNLEIESQSNEIKNAPSIYKRIGIIPTVEATVKRISGWESRTKEFVHNVFLSNRPERLNVWMRQRNSADEWSEPTEPLSLDFAYEGRPTAVRDGDGTLWLFYHTQKKRKWKRDKTYRETCNIWYKTFDMVHGWTPSKPLTNRLSIDKYPSTAMQGDTIWVFWSVYNEKDDMWHIEYRTRTEEGWSPLQSNNEPFANLEAERKKPLVTADNTGGLWLFWLERVGAQWQMKYSRYDGSAWGPAVSFPLDGGQDPRVEGDPFVLFHPSEGPARRLLVFWARQEPTGEPGQTRWTVVYRVKENTNLDASGWSSVRTLSTVPPEYHDREPAAFVNAAGDIELFWSSNRDGNWSIWQRTLDVAADTWGPEQQGAVTTYSQRDPLPLSIADDTLLIYHSNESLSYASQVYGATETIDFRYAGCTTVHTRDAEKIALRGEFEDFQTYTYDAGKDGKRANEDWYARDTIGLYLEPSTMDAEKLNSGIARIGKVLKEFMPITDRAVFVTRPDLYAEYVYTYGLPLIEESRFINESYKDELTSLTEEVVTGPGEEFSDEIG